MRLALLLLALAVWPPLAGAVALFFINGLGDSGAFTESPEVALRSLRLAAIEGFEFGARAMPLISLGPAVVTFAARRWLPRVPDIGAGALGALAMFAIFIGWIIVEPLDPLLGGILPLVLIVLLVAGTFTGFVIAWLRPRATPPTSTP